MNFNDMITRMENYEYTTEFYELQKDAYELSILETAYDSYLFNSDNNFFEGVYLEAKKAKSVKDKIQNKKESLWDKIVKWFKDLWKQIIAWWNRIWNKDQKELDQEASKLSTEECEERIAERTNSSNIIDNSVSEGSYSSSSTNNNSSISSSSTSSDSSTNTSSNSSSSASTSSTTDNTNSNTSKSNSKNGVKKKTIKSCKVKIGENDKVSLLVDAKFVKEGRIKAVVDTKNEPFPLSLENMIDVILKSTNDRPSEIKTSLEVLEVYIRKGRKIESSIGRKQMESFDDNVSKMNKKIDDITTQISAFSSSNEHNDTNNKVGELYVEFIKKATSFLGSTIRFYTQSIELRKKYVTN